MHPQPARWSDKEVPRCTRIDIQQQPCRCSNNHVQPATTRLMEQQLCYWIEDEIEGWGSIGSSDRAALVPYPLALVKAKSV